MTLGLELNIGRKIELLLIEDNIHDARIFEEHLNTGSGEFEITHVSDIKSSLENIAENSFDIIVADLNLPDSKGLETFKEIKKIAGNTPIVILSGVSDSSLTIESIKIGAQDYIYKGNYEGDFIYRVIHYAIERKKLLKEIEEQSKKLAELNKNLQELNYNKDKMYSIISHDLLSPMNALKGYSELLKESYKELSEEEKLNMIDTINELTVNSIELTKDLLLWSAANTGHFDYKPEKLDIASIIKKQCELLKLTANKKNITIITEVTDMFVLADRTMIETVVRNLVSNSIKFTPQLGKIYILNFGSGDMVTVTIEDTGIGMDQGEVNKLFKAEENVSRTGTSMEKGIGLGLLICKEFIAKNNGAIDVFSRKGICTSFLFTLPKG
jgi:signal transduction histidine kinase